MVAWLAAAAACTRALARWVLSRCDAAQVEAKNSLENYAFNMRNTIRDEKVRPPPGCASRSCARPVSIRAHARLRHLLVCARDEGYRRKGTG